MGIGSLLVKRNNKAVGIITERDVVRRVDSKNLNPAGITVEKVMSKPLITVNSDATVFEAARLTAQNRIRRLPIVQGADLVGIVTSTDLVKYLGQIAVHVVTSYGDQGSKAVVYKNCESNISALASL